MGEEIRQDFQRHVPVQLRVPGPIHFPHAASADEGGDFIGAEARAWAEGHGKMAGLYRSGAFRVVMGKRTWRMLSDDPVDLSVAL